MESRSNNWHNRLLDTNASSLRIGRRRSTGRQSYVRRATAKLPQQSGRTAGISTRHRPLRGRRVRAQSNGAGGINETGALHRRCECPAALYPGGWSIAWNEPICHCLRIAALKQYPATMNLWLSQESLTKGEGPSPQPSRSISLAGRGSQRKNSLPLNPAIPKSEGIIMA